VRRPGHEWLIRSENGNRAILCMSEGGRGARVASDMVSDAVCWRWGWRMASDVVSKDAAAWQESSSGAGRI
jgi:hypothetical protein